MNRLSKGLVIFGALLIWYTLIGFLIAPALIRHFGEAHLRENFSAESAIAQVRINPFTGSFRIEGLKLADAAGAWSVAWQEAELNVSALSLLKFYPVVDALRLVGADVRYEKRPSEAAVTDEPVTEGSDDWRELVKELNFKEIPELRVDLLEVSDGRIEFVDQTAAADYKKTIDPINFTLRDLTTAAEGDSAMRFVAESDEGATVSWEGDFRSLPIRSAGTFSLSGLAVHDLSPYYTQFIRFKLNRAVFGLSFDYQLNLSDLENLFQIQNGQVALNEVLCVPIDEDEQLISVDSVVARGIEFRFPQMALEVASIQVASGETRVFRDADGQINLAQLIALPAVTAEPKPEKAPSAGSALPALSYRIAQVGLTDYRIVWEEALLDGMANLTVEIPSMQISEVSSDLESPFQLAADYKIGESGTAHIEGSVIAAGPVLDLALQLQSVPLQLLSPYAQNFGKTEISQGTFDFDGRFQFAAKGAQTLTGAAAIQGIDFVYDGNLQAQWAALNLEGLQLELAPFGLAMESLTLEKPNIVFTQQASAKSAETRAEPAAVAPSEAAATDRAPTPIRVGSFKISEGSVTYIDQSLAAESQVVMDALQLELSGLDLAGSEPADVALSTQINGSSLQVDGALNLSQLKETTRLKASLSGLSLPAFSGYSGQAIGRRIANGSFNLESDWVIEASQLKASNKIRIEQLKFGDKVDSENAVNLPLDLAVTLLKGPSGVMDLSLPLSGDLSDPKVGIGQIVRTAIVGLITNVATSPFKLLSGLVGAEEDLSVVNFDAGSAALTPAMVTRINTLAAALKERPGLKLAITPQISTADEVKLAEEKLRVDLLGESDPSDEKLYRRRLAKRYRETMKAAGTPEVEVDVDDEAGFRSMVAALLPGVELADADRATLAAARAAAIREHLMAAQGIAGERLSLANPEIGASESGARFILK